MDRPTDANTIERQRHLAERDDHTRAALPANQSRQYCNLAGSLTRLTGRSVQLFSIAVFYLLIFAVGIWAGRRRGDDQTSSGLLVAGRGMPMFIGVLTMTATWVGGGYINGTAEAIYSSTQGIVWTQAPWGYALSMVLGGLFFARKMRRQNFTTLLDPFEQRYGKTAASLLFVPALLGELFWSAAILVALGTTFATVLHFDVSTSILISAAVAIGYTVVGGLWSVAYTDVVQLVFLFSGLCVAMPFAVSNVGGLDAVLQTTTEMPAFPTGPDIWLWLDMALLLCLGGIPWQVYFQRVLAAKDEQTAVSLSLWAALGCLLMAFPAVVIGATGIAADWSSTELGEAPQAALVLPSVLAYMTPPAVATIGLGAVAAAVMSSVDSSILSASSMFVWNVYRPLARPDAGDRELRLVLRIAVMLIGIAAAILALSVQSVYALWYLCADLVYVMIFPQLVMVLFSQRSNRVGAFAGAIVGLTLRLGGGEPFMGIPAWIPYPLATEDGGTNFPFRTVAMLCGMITIWLVSQLGGRGSCRAVS
ncbi:MAG: sodium:solute symporter family protein [Planctomycetaceae bacterium]|nr:sodium:solute symporter family protein [Planctomycetaceae bacterium]